MASGKKRTSFMKLARDRELAEKRALKAEKRAARRLSSQEAQPSANAEAETGGGAAPDADARTDSSSADVAPPGTEESGASR